MQEHSRQILLPGMKLSYDHPPLLRGLFSSASCAPAGAEALIVSGNCNRSPVPTQRLQPLRQGLWPCQLPLHRGAKPAGNPENFIDFRQVNCRKSGRRHAPPGGCAPPLLVSFIAFITARTARRGAAPRKTGFAGAPFDSIDFRQVNCRKSGRRHAPPGGCAPPLLVSFIAFITARTARRGAHP